MYFKVIGTCQRKLHGINVSSLFFLISGTNVSSCETFKKKKSLKEGYWGMKILVSNNYNILNKHSYNQYKFKLHQVTTLDNIKLCQFCSHCF